MNTVILKHLNTLRMLFVKRWILFDFHYLNSRPLERGPFPSINNWHLITYPPRCGQQALWCELRSSISTVLRIDRWADRRTIKGIPCGAVNTRSTHAPGMWSSTNPAITSLYIPLLLSWLILYEGPLIWVKYSQKITKQSEWHHLKWKTRTCSIGDCCSTCVLAEHYRWSHS